MLFFTALEGSKLNSVAGAKSSPGSPQTEPRTYLATGYRIRIHCSA